MWIKTEGDKAVDASKIVGLSFQKDIAQDGNTTYRVYALTLGGYSFFLKTLDTEDDAKKCIEEIVHALNGDEKVGYSFSWLNKSTPAETEKPVDNNPALIDGIAL